jgi:5,10-methylenetetrahydrofolate reductase
MEFKNKLLNPQEAVILFEMVPPVAGKPEALAAAVEEAKKVRHLVDGFNLPEIRDESRGEERTFKFVPRVEPRVLGREIRQNTGAEIIINRCVVHDRDQARWFCDVHKATGLSNVVLVGGESSAIQYPGPGVTEAARQILGTGIPVNLGAITLPNRTHEAERVQQKHAAGLSFFTSQVLFDSNDIVWLIQRLNGLNARVFLSFAPVSHPRDLEFLRWLGADVPADLDVFLLQNSPAPHNAAGQSSHMLDRSLDLAQRILMDVFDNLPPDPPSLGLNIEHINRRNFAPAVRMLDRLGRLYRNLVAARARTSLV